MMMPDHPADCSGLQRNGTDEQEAGVRLGFADQGFHPRRTVIRHFSSEVVFALGFPYACENEKNDPDEGEKSGHREHAEVVSDVYIARDKPREENQ